MENKEEKVIKSRRSGKSILLIALIASVTLLGAYGIERIHAENKEAIDYIQEERSSEEDYAYLRKCAEDNETINTEDNLVVLDEYLKILSECELTSVTTVNIGNRLRKVDFSAYDFNSKEIISVLNTILFIDDHRFVSEQLYDYNNGFLTKDGVANVLKYDEDIATRLINGEEIDKILKKEYKVKYDDIKETEEREYNNIFYNLEKKKILY